jgi:sodium-dependent dicarboxylate transporter 2/3/5
MEQLRKWGRWLALPCAVVATVSALVYGGWPREQAFMAGILALAAVLWITEALPLFATALLIITAEIFLLANPGGWPGFGFAAGGGTSFAAILAAAANPMLVLFLGGLLLARAAVKEGVDQTMAAWLLRPFVHNRRKLLYGVLGVTALFSMWMSNTATGAFMLTLIMPLLAQVPPADPYRKALLLAVPFAAGIGALATPISSPPNVIAMDFIQRGGYQIGFLHWMIVAVPLTVLLLALTGWLLERFFGRLQPDAATSFTLAAPPLTDRGRRVVGIFVATVLLWLTEGLHGMPAAVVALLPIVSLLLVGTITRDDINRIEWDVLILIGGGLALGYGLNATQLDLRLVALLPPGAGTYALVVMLILATLVLGTFLSNTAVANLLLPIGFAASATQVHQPALLIGIAFIASLTMALPISTPPNAMAYARGEFSTWEMAKVGGLLGLAGASLILIALAFIV